MVEIIQKPHPRRVKTIAIEEVPDYIKLIPQTIKDLATGEPIKQLIVPKKYCSLYAKIDMRVNSTRVLLVEFDEKGRGYSRVTMKHRPDLKAKIYYTDEGTNGFYEGLERTLTSIDICGVCGYPLNRYVSRDIPYSSWFSEDMVKVADLYLCSSCGYYNIRFNEDVKNSPPLQKLIQEHAPEMRGNYAREQMQEKPLLKTTAQQRIR